MSSPLKTLLLDVDAWDLVLDSNGDIALASPPYATAQDVASACRLFLGEAWYDTTQGVTFWNHPDFSAAALTVPGVVKSNTVVTSTANREESGQVQFTTSDGISTTVNY